MRHQCAVTLGVASLVLCASCAGSGQAGTESSQNDVSAATEAGTDSGGKLDSGNDTWGVDTADDGATAQGADAPMQEDTSQDIEASDVAAQEDVATQDAILADVDSADASDSSGPEVHVCDSDSECEKGLICASHACVPGGGATIGQSCQGDADCASGRCVDVSGDSKPVCVPCVEDADCGPQAYCESHKCHPKKGIGQQCGTDAECFSGHCQAEKCLTCVVTADCPQGTYCSKEGSCHPLLPPLADCTHDEQCKSGTCKDGHCFGCAESTGCPTGTYCDQDKGDCVLKLHNGEEAASADMCASEHLSEDGKCAPCEEGASCSAGWVCSGGVCTPPLQNGAKCDADVQCLSGQCVDGECKPQVLTCDLDAFAQPLEDDQPGTVSCPQLGPGFGGDAKWFTNFFATATPGGLPAPCAIWKACYSSCGCGKATCDAIFSQAMLQRCQEAFPTDDTASLAKLAVCNEARNAMLAIAKGATGEAQWLDGVQACSGQPAKAGAFACQSDDECQPEAFCQDGVCTALLAEGLPCGDDAQCVSGHCVGGACSACPACGEGEACQEGECKSLEPAGSPCFNSWECQSGYCHMMLCTECGPAKDCGEDEFCWQGLCHARKGLFQPCTDGFMCKSGYCVDFVCQECGDDADCADNEFCEVGICHSRKQNGFPCLEDKECLSQHCATGVCVACQANEDCPADNFCELGICHSKKQDGFPCTASDQCQSGHCDPPVQVSLMSDVNPGVCGECAKDSDCAGNEFCLFGVCHEKKGLGMPCHAASWCYSGYCNVLILGGLCSCNPYLPSETVCDDDQYCAMAPGYPVCLPKMSNGLPCNLNVECLSGHCLKDPLIGLGGACTQCVDDADCKADEFCEVGVCHAKLDPNKPCLNDNMCKSGLCKLGLCAECSDNSQCPSDKFCETVTATCVPKLTFPAPCTDGYQCVSGVCGDIAGVGPSVCGCASNEECDADQFCETNSHACVPNLTFPALCTDGYQCVSGICGDIAGVGPSVCGCGSNEECDSNQFCETNSHACVQKYPSSTPCTDGYQCESGNCKKCGSACIPNPFGSDWCFTYCGSGCKDFCVGTSCVTVCAPNVGVCS